MNLHELAIDDVVSTADASSLGMTPDHIAALVRRGTLRRLIRGWYAVWSPGAPRPPWVGDTAYENVERLHVLTARALVRSFEGRVVASHQSALLLHGARLWNADLSTVHLTRVGSTHSRHRAGAVIHPMVNLPTAESPLGVATVGLATAVVQVGLVGQRGGRIDPLHALVAADGLLHGGGITREQLEEAVEEFRHTQGIAPVRRLLVHADGRHESVGETRTAYWLRLLGYRFVPQVERWFCGKQYFGDFELEEERVLVEFDGLAKYGMTREGNADETPLTVRRALAAEKVREDRYRAEGYGVARIVWEDLERPQRIKAKVEQARYVARVARLA